MKKFGNLSIITFEVYKKIILLRTLTSIVFCSRLMWHVGYFLSFQSNTLKFTIFLRLILSIIRKIILLEF